MDGLKIYDADSKITSGGKFDENNKYTLDCGNEKIKGISGTYKTNYN